MIVDVLGTIAIDDWKCNARLEVGTLKCLFKEQLMKIKSVNYVTGSKGASNTCIIYRN